MFLIFKMNEKYLSKEKLEGFEKYKYNSIDSCILSVYIMHPFWDWCVKFFPRWIAPNLLTFTGFLLTVVNFLLFSYYDYGFHLSTKSGMVNHIPSWVWALSSINLFFAYTLDGIDGKQARRTGTSGPLGELFDHGLDSYSAVLIPTCLYSIFGRDQLTPLRMYFVVWNILVNFYLPHWEKYNTGVMFLPWGYDFTMVGVVILLLVTAVVGPEAWHVSLPGNWTPGVLFELILYASAILTSQTVIIWNIYRSYKDKTGKMRSFNEAVMPLVPLVIFFTISTLWAIYSSSNIVERDPRMFYILMGTIFSNINCRLIVSQMSDTRCQAFNSLLYPYAFVALICVTLPVSTYFEVTCLYILCTISTISHIHYGAGVVREMCDHFGIKCFKIKSEQNGKKY